MVHTTKTKDGEGALNIAWSMTNALIVFVVVYIYIYTAFIRCN